MCRWWASYVAMILFKAQADLEHRSLVPQTDLTTGSEQEPDPFHLTSKQKLISSALDTISVGRIFKNTASDYSRIHPLLSIVFREALLTIANACTNPHGFIVDYGRDYDDEIIELCEIMRDMARRNPYTAALALRTYREICDRSWHLPPNAVRHLLHIQELYPTLST